MTAYGIASRKFDNSIIKTIDVIIKTINNILKYFYKITIISSEIVYILRGKYIFMTLTFS